LGTRLQSLVVVLVPASRARSDGDAGLRQKLCSWARAGNASFGRATGGQSGREVGLLRCGVFVCGGVNVLLANSSHPSRRLSAHA